MINPISSTGRAFERSVNYGTRLGLSPEQATDRSSGLLLSPELQKMMQQVQYLQQQRPQMPQGTIAQQLNQLTGISALPTPQFNPRFANGGIVAFAGPEGSLVVDDMIPRLTPEQIRLQQQIREAAERRMGLGSYGIGLENYPEFNEDMPDIKTQVVDDKGDIWQKTEKGGWRNVSEIKRLQGTTLEASGIRYADRPSPMQREIEAYRRTQAAGAGGGGGGEGIRAAAAEAGAAAEKPGLIRRGLGALARGAGALAGATGIGAMLSDVGERAESMQGKGGPQGPVIPIGAYGVAYSPETAPKPGDIGDMFSSLISGATLGMFGDREKERAAEKPKPAAPKPAAPKPAPAAAPVARPAEARMGMFDIPIGIESARAALESAVTEDSEYQKLLKRAQQEGTGPYSKMFTEGDRIKSEQIARLKESKDRGFARSLVAAGLAMAEQASKGGQPGNEAQKFLAAAVAGLGGYAKAQEKLEEEANKSQRELDKFTLDMEQLREASRGELRGSALQRYNQAQARAEKARDNIKAYTIVGAQLEASMAATGMKTAATMAGIQQRAQKALVDAALKDLEGDLGYQQLKLKQAQAKTPQEKAAAARDIEAAIQAQAQRIMAIPSRAAAVQYETGGAGAAGDVDFSGADDIAKMALGMTGG